MTNFKLTPKLTGIIQRSSLSEVEKEEILKNELIAHDTLVDFYRKCKPTASMLELLQTTQLVVPNKNPRNDSAPKTAEFVKSMEYLRLRSKEEEYQKLVNPSTAMHTLYEPKFDDEPYDRVKEQKETKNHITTMFNILISIASVVYAIWYWTESSWKIRDSYRVLLCLFFGIVILVAEVVVYMGYLRRVEEAKVKERGKKEVKKVIRSYTVN